MSALVLKYLPLLAGLSALLLTCWKIWTDRARQREHLAFIRTERAIRENHERNETLKRELFEQCHATAAAADREMWQRRWEHFETAEREKRETFEAVERSLRAHFISAQENARVTGEARIKQDIEACLKLEKWREETWQRNLARLEHASKYLSGTTSGLMSLIDEGPVFNDARMIQETARVLDVFGDFQSSVGHFAMPVEMALLSKQLIAHITRIFLTLSPLQSVRRDEERHAALFAMRGELERMSDAFLRRCADFERDPGAFLQA